MITAAHKDGARVVTGAPRGEIKALTGLRAVAAMWVVLYHVTWLSGDYLDQVPFLRPILAAGWTGVELFFVLSGFVIARSYLEEMGSRWQTGKALRFMYNRFARVWPAYATVTVFAFAWLFLIGHLGWAVDVVAPHPEATIAELGRQLSMSQMWGESSLTGQSFNPPGWSISAEWLAYLAFPVLALLLRPLRRLHPVALLVLSCGAMGPLFLNAFVDGTPDVATNWLLRIACCFVAGILACLAVQGLQGGARAEQWGLVLSVSSLIGIVVVCYWAHARQLVEPGEYVGTATILYPLLIVGLTLTSRGPASVLAKSPLVYGGRLSYCLYLVHFVVMDVVVTTAWQDVQRRGSVPPMLALLIPGMVFASLAGAAMLHHGVEEPARKALLALLRRAEVSRGRRAGGQPDAGSSPIAAESHGRLASVEPTTERLKVASPTRESVLLRRPTVSEQRLAVAGTPTGRERIPAARADVDPRRTVGRAS